MMNGFRIGAAACGAAYILSILFLPFLSIMNQPFSGMEIMSDIGWVYLSLAAGLAILICALVCPGKIGGIVSIIGAVTALISFFLVKPEAGGLVRSYFSQMGKGNYYYIGIGIGAGVILAALLAAGSAVLCFLADGNLGRPKSQSVGLTSDNGDEW